MSSLGELVRQLRQAAGLTQEELAESSGLSPRTVSDVERGLRSRLYPDTAQRLADALSLGGGPRDAFLQAAKGRTPAASAVRPRPLTPLVGRDAEVALLAQELQPQHRRLVTITGLGGMGKTRLALAVADALDPAYDGRVRFVAIAANQQPEHVIGLVSSSVGASQATSPEQLGALLAGRATLVVLDAFEHVQPAAPALEALLVAVTSLHLLVTSRERLHISGERELALTPLPMPDASSSSWAETGAAALFLDRARDARTDLTYDADVVIDICRRVSGVPLALELAAARARHLPLGSVRDRLRTGLSDLVDHESGGERSMVETLAWTTSSLTQAEAAVLGASALFAGGCSLPALQSVCAPDLDVVAATSGLVDKGLLSLDGSDEGAGATPRWRMLDVVREFVMGRAGRVSRGARDAYQQVFVGLLERATEDMGREDDWFGLLAREEPNLRTALQWAEADGEAETLLRLGCGMWQYWQATGALAEGRRWLETGLRTRPAAPDPIRMTALWGVAWLAYHQGDDAAARDAGTELQVLADRHDDASGRRNAATVLGMLAIAEDQPDAALSLLGAALEIARGLERPWILATSLLNLGLAHLCAGDPRSARDAVGEALRAYAAIGDQRFEARSQGYLGLICLVEHDLPRARTLAQRSLGTFHRLGEPAGMAEGLVALAAVAAREGHPVDAARLAGAAGRIREGYAGRELPLDRRITLTHLTQARVRLGDAAWEAAFSEGHDRPLDEAVAAALGTP